MNKVEKMPGYIELGNLNEKGVCEIVLDVSAWLELYPTGQFSITYTRPGEDDVYPVAAGDLSTATVGLVTTLTWTVSDAVTAIAGSGSMVVQLAVDTDIVKRSEKVQTVIAPGHASAGDPPTPVSDWIEDANGTLDGLKAITFTLNSNGELEVNI